MSSSIHNFLQGINRKIKSSRRKTKVVFLLLLFSDLSHHRTCGSAYGGSLPTMILFVVSHQ